MMFDRGKAHIWTGPATWTATGDLSNRSGAVRPVSTEIPDNLLRWCLWLRQNRWVDQGLARRKGRLGGGGLQLLMGYNPALQGTIGATMGQTGHGRERMDGRDGELPVVDMQVKA